MRTSYSSITGVLAEPGLTHDTDGNMTQDGTWTYAYGGDGARQRGDGAAPSNARGERGRVPIGRPREQNRLKSMVRAGQTLTFTYDYADRRVRKQVTGTGASDTKFIWSGWTLAAETIADGYSILRTHIWGPDFSNAQGAAGGAGALLGTYNAGFVLTFAVPDSMGHIVGHLDTAGNVAAQVEYSVFGRVISSSGSVANHPIGYAGQYTDGETGLLYYGYRYYSPRHSRFVNRDPIEESGGNNLYGFVGNNPTSRWDVLGLCYFSDGIFMGCDGLTRGSWDIGFDDGADEITTSTGLWDPMIWIYMHPTKKRWRPFTDGTFTRPNVSFNDGWQRDWRKRDAIYWAQGAANSEIIHRGPAGKRIGRGTVVGHSIEERLRQAIVHTGSVSDAQKERLIQVLARIGENGGPRGREMVERIISGGLEVKWDRRGPSGGPGNADEPLPLIRLDPNDPDFVGQLTREQFAREGIQDQIPGKHTAEIVVGHELSHALYGTPDPRDGSSGVTSVTHENELREAFGLPPRPGYHEFEMVDDVWRKVRP